MGVYQRRPEFVQAEQFTLENFQKMFGFNKWNS